MSVAINSDRANGSASCNFAYIAETRDQVVVSRTDYYRFQLR